MTTADAVLFTPIEVADWLADSMGLVAVRPGVRYVSTIGAEQCLEWPLDLTLHTNNELIASRGDSVCHSYLTDNGDHIHLIAHSFTDEQCPLHRAAVDLTTVD